MKHIPHIPERYLRTVKNILSTSVKVGAIALVGAIGVGALTYRADSTSAYAEPVTSIEHTPLAPVIEQIEKTPAKPEHLSFASPQEILDYMDASPDSARYHRGILPRMAETAPEYAESLLNSHSRRFIVADKAKMRVFVYDSCGVVERSFGMAAGKGLGNKHKRGDSRTPEGFFRVEGVYNSTEWLYTDDEGNTSQVKGQYGPRFIRIHTVPQRWPIGIHGTCAPWSIGGRRSHGCMRLKNDDIMALVEYVEKGMPVIISPGTRDQKVNTQEGTPTRRVWTGEGSQGTVASR